jgi:hypothetical protein
MCQYSTEFRGFGIVRGWYAVSYVKVVLPYSAADAARLLDSTATTLPEILQIAASTSSSPNRDSSSSLPDVCALAVGDNVSAVDPHGDATQVFAGRQTRSLSLRMARRKRFCPYVRPAHDKSIKALGVKRQTARQVQATRMVICNVHRDDLPQPDSKAAGSARSWISSAILLTMGVLCLLATTIALC